ncbi:MAG: DNA polymerase III alpha subunit (EC [uncultured Campylobacterales bacterium]|uniref:DNA polymerase III subunit alpha n=1 Tax=uncultured Campylobacterales bacterium TaxID=352960 RepID=A0A6S6SLL3_9BACT|nr:MAG: DNA polymerase III alpha subunit (EC [uncultured Campylobacterales bacterium]
MTGKYTHLHLHTEYSLLDGANKIKLLAKKLKSQGVESVAMTDHGNMFGAIDFYQTMKKEGIKPIIGLEAYLHNEDEVDNKKTRRRHHVCLYAKNEIGYKNLMYISSQSYINGFYYFPRINKKMLEERSEGLVCSSACLQGEISWELNTNNPRNVKFGACGYEGAKKAALWYQKTFGEDFYIEIMRHGIEDQRLIDEKLIRISKETGIKLIATNDAHYTEKISAEAHEAFMCIAMNKEFDDPNRLRHSVQEFYIKTPEQMHKLFADIPDAVENTQEIVNKCNLEIKLGNPTPPKFKFTAEYAKNEGLDIINDEEYFEYKCKEGLEKRLKIVDIALHNEYKKRLDYEIKIINNMKFPGYMLIVWDFIKVAREMDIPVGPGRGSAAGSLVAYSLSITDIDPMKYNLLFERFLNPERVSMPDIDIDFCQHRRSEIIDYVVEKYGRYNVAQVITFGKLLAKGVIRDVARVMGMPYARADAMSKLIPDELKITLESAYEKEPKLKELVNSDALAKRVWDLSIQLEGLNRNAGMHAAGLVISDEELWHKSPLYKPAGMDHLVTQYSLNYLEDVDLIKFDFLGLKTLTVIDNALKLIKKKYDKTINFDTIDTNDKKVYELIQTGHTLGLFQIESSGMQDLNKKLKPTNFEDLIAVLALYRPGPMESGMLDDFIDRKHGKTPISYFFDEFTEILEPILKPTYGVIVYQEQVMQIVQSIGGFSLGESDVIRRAMGKKKLDLMEEYANEFAARAQKQGYSKEHARELFVLIEKFAGYGFNKSHSAAYAMITFETSYLKAYYPTEFMAALLTSEQNNTDKIVKYVDEVKRLGIELLPPNINKSFVEFSSEGKSILFGLGAIKGVGASAVESIINARETKQFESLSEFISEIDSRKVNKRVLESLTKSGGLDCFGHTRRTLIENIEHIIDKAGEINRAKEMAKNSLFGDNTEELTNISIVLDELEPYDNKTVLEFEKETLGFYVSGHPLDAFKEELASINYTLSSQIDELDDGSNILIVGKIEEIQEKISKKGHKFGILKIMDLHGSIELTVFASMLEEIQEMNLDKPLCFKVNISKNEQFTRMKILKIIDLKKAKKEKVQIKKTKILKDPIEIIIEYKNHTQLEKLYDLVSKYNRGDHPLHLVLSTEQGNIIMETPFLIDANVLDGLKKEIA